MTVLKDSIYIGDEGVAMKKLGFGMMRLPLKDSNDLSSVDMQLSARMVDASLTGVLRILTRLGSTISAIVRRF